MFSYYIMPLTQSGTKGSLKRTLSNLANLIMPESPKRSPSPKRSSPKLKRPPRHPGNITGKTKGIAYKNGGKGNSVSRLASAKKNKKNKNSKTRRTKTSV